MKKSSIPKVNEMKPEPSAMPATAPAGLKPEEMGEHSDYDVTGGLDTLMKAHKISNDPDLLGKIQKHAKAQKNAMNSVGSMFKATPDDSEGPIESMDGFKKRRQKNEINPVGDE